MNNKHHRALELDKVLRLLAELCICGEAKEAALSVTPAGTCAEAVRAMTQTSDAHALTGRYGSPGISALSNCSEVVGKAQVGAMLSLRELLDMAAILRCARALIRWKSQSDASQTSLDAMFSMLEANKPLEDDITENILSDEELSDRASPELYDIRRGIRQAQLKAREQLDRITRSETTRKYLQEQIVTIRNGRFVVPVRAEYRNEIKGIVHDTSSSGATLFVEPIQVVEANNRIRELESSEQHEINRILLDFSARIGENADLIRSNYDIILLLDLVFAKAKLADRMRAMAPEIVETGETRLNKARHPLIDADRIVPVDIMIGGDFDTLVITGPNTGGKTVALKTAGLLTLMASCGLMIPCADQSRVCFCTNVLADIGDEQSIEQSLSTFSSHMTNIISILEQAGKGSLVLIDELGAGTDPVEGAALAVAIISSLREKGARIVATTHYAEIKMYALQTPGVENASCEFDVSTLRPTYRLLIGIPGRSNAFAISERLGLPQDVIEKARTQMSTENTRFEDVVSGLEEMRRQLEEERELASRYRSEADALHKQANELRHSLEKDAERELRNAREKAQSIVAQVKFQSDQLLNELEEMKKQKNQAGFSDSVSNAKSAMRAYINDLEDLANPVTGPAPSAYRLPRKLRRGDRVRLMDFGSDGTVLADQDDSGMVSVQAGIVKTKVALHSLRLLDPDTGKQKQKGGVHTGGVTASAKQAIKSEVDLRGMDANEAVMELERYIDSAILSNVKTIMVIHGKGTGALRSAVQNRLRRHRSVEGFRQGVYGEGEAGVTVVELK